MTVKRFAPAQRVLHWLMAACILTMLFLGVGMVSTIAPKYLTLLQIHKTLGIAILLLAVVRLLLRLVNPTPPLPRDMPVPMRLAADASQYIFYALMFVMPLLGWAMLSSASHPVVLWGSLHLPAILPLNPVRYAQLRVAHTYLGFAFFALILMHVSALMFHKLVRKDGVFETMGPVVTENQQRELAEKHV